MTIFFPGRDHRKTKKTFVSINEKGSVKYFFFFFLQAIKQEQINQDMYIPNIIQISIDQSHKLMKRLQKKNLS